jgi:hypothetical protein
LTSFLEQAGCWFLRSGIQDASGGVARYYRSDSGANAPVSNEITGYAVSTLAYLHSRTGTQQYLDASVRAAQYLSREAWDLEASTFPFEPGADRAYFFDLGIITRGLLSAWRATGEEEFNTRARDAALSLAFDFLDDAAFYPVISLPEKQPVPPDGRWSRRSGCYQLKSALGWLELDAQHASPLFERMLAYSLATHQSFLDGETDRERLMDRLHAYCYFLEALLWVADRADVRGVLAGGILRIGALLREIAPVFERSDVGAQLLRIRLIADYLGAVSLDEQAAGEEAERVISFQAPAEAADPRVRGGFWFGRKGAAILPFANPVSTAFCAQALALWGDHQAGRWSFQLPQLI